MVLLESLILFASIYITVRFRDLFNPDPPVLFKPLLCQIILGSSNQNWGNSVAQRFCRALKLKDFAFKILTHGDVKINALREKP